MNKIKLNEMLNGALQEKFQHSFARVIENMQDMNTPYKDKREIIIKMTFEQNEQRDNVIADIKVKEKLASQAALCTQFAIGRDWQTGNLVAEEYGSQLRGQAMLEYVDAATGEVLSGTSIQRRGE